MEPTKPVLNYAPSQKRRRRWLFLVVAIVLLIAGVWVYRIWGETIISKVKCRYWVYQCLHYRGSPDAEAPGMPECWYHFAKTDYSPPQNGDWISDTVPGESTTEIIVFLHERVEPGGGKRLVVINATVWRSLTEEYLANPLVTDKRPNYMIFFHTRVVDTSFIYRNPDAFTPGSFGAGSPSWIMGNAKKMRLMNGQPDPDDQSHFSFVYDMDGLRGTIDGWLRDDKTVKLKLRDGPALPYVEDPER